MRAATGGISLFSLLLLMVGLGLLTFQIVYLAGGPDATTSPAVAYFPGVMGIVFIVMFGMKAFRRGEVIVTLDEVHGRKASGKSYRIALAEISAIDLHSRMLALRGNDGKYILVDSPPYPHQVKGLIWFLRKYPDWAPAIWQGIQPETTEKFGDAIRRFLHEDDKVAFVDIGFLLEVEGRRAYLPATDTAALPQKIEGEQSLSTTLKASGILLKFDPNPTLLPIRQLCEAISGSGLSTAEADALFRTLIDNHGGTYLTATDDAEDYAGETLGWQVSVVPKIKAD